MNYLFVNGRTIKIAPENTTRPFMSRSTNIKGGIFDDYTVAKEAVLIVR